MKIAKRSYSEAFEKVQIQLIVCLSDVYHAQSDRQLRSLLRHGIPFDLRSKIWTM